ncbi:hypothetical protein GCM10027615_07200 [Plantactinospora veratri]
MTSLTFLCRSARTPFRYLSDDPAFPGWVPANPTTAAATGGRLSPAPPGKADEGRRGGKGGVPVRPTRTGESRREEAWEAAGWTSGPAIPRFRPETYG